MAEPNLSRWRNAVFAIFFANGLIMASWISRIPAVRDLTGASLEAMGLAIFASAVGAIVGLGLSSVLLARLGARRAMALTIGIFLLGAAICGIGATLFGDLTIVAAGQFLFGLGIGSTDVAMNVEGAAAERAIGKTLMPMMHAFYSFGTVAGAIAGAIVVSLNISVLSHLLGASLAAGLIAVWALLVLPDRVDTGDVAAVTDRAHWRVRLAEYFAVWREPAVVLIGVGVLAMGFAEGAANDWIALGLVDGHGYSQALGAVVFGVFVAGMTLVRLIGGPIVDRIGRVRALRYSAVAAFAGVALFVWAEPLWLIMVGAAIWGFGAALGFPLGMSAAADHPNGAARVGAVSIVGYAAFLIGPPLLGFLGERIGLLLALTVILPLAAVAAVIAPAARERSGPHALDANQDRSKVN